MDIRDRLLSAAATVVLLSLPLLSPFPAGAQVAGRLWGRVETATGDVYQGFIRWDRNETSWVDVLNGSKEIPWENFELWQALADLDEEDRERTIEIFNIRISWDDDEPNFPETAESGIRFGHVRRLFVVDDDRVELELKSGRLLELEGGSTDIGDEIREIVVSDPDRGEVELEWRDLEEIEFRPAPSDVTPGATRLHGTVEDQWGRTFTGYISWDLDEVLTSDVLDGEERGRDREIPFRNVAAIEQVRDGSLVVLANGEELELSDSNDVDDGHRGVQISDPALGMVEVEWDEFSAIRFHEPSGEADFDAFDGGHRLRGTVVTRSGEEHTGWIRWDADEEYSWELLDGEDRDVVFDVEFGAIARIERMSSRSADVTLLDGRVFELEDSNDVDEGNKGIFIQVDDSGDPQEGWVLVSWDDFREIRFDHGR
jgi:hypothetical protein